MLDALKKFFAGPSVADRSKSGLEAWCAQRGYTLRTVQGADGLVIDGILGGVPFRLEWGPSQRRYIQGAELRLRAETPFLTGLQVLVVDNPLQREMEREVFEEYVEDTRTRIDTSTPPEMRWLVMLEKIDVNGAAPWRARCSAVASDPFWAAKWLGGAAGAALGAFDLAPGQPLVLMINRGRLTLRTALGQPDLAPVATWTALFEAAVAGAVDTSQRA